MAQRLRQWSGFWSLKELIPDPIVRLGERILRRDGKVKPEWDESVLREAEERLAPDAARMLDYCKRSRGLWSFDTLSLEEVDPASDVGTTT